MRDNPMKAKLRAGHPALGIWCGLGSEVSVEVAGRLGFDWALLDCEHGLTGSDQVLPLVRAAHGYGISPVVRVPSAASAADAAAIARVLDTGAEGVLAPMIRTQAEVAQFVSACRYPPAGRRGIASSRAHGYGVDFQDYFQRSNDEVLVMAQIETAEALEEVEAIAAVDGLDALFIGPTDLSAALGTPNDKGSAAVATAIERIVAACQSANKPLGIYCSTPADARKYLAQGFAFVNVCNDQSLLVKAIAGALQQMAD